MALFLAVIVGGTWISGTLVAFVAIALFEVVVIIFPYSIVGIVGMEMQTSAHGFNNSGLEIGVTSFSVISEFSVQMYGTESMSPKGTDNQMALPWVLFLAGIACTIRFRLRDNQA